MQTNIQQSKRPAGLAAAACDWLIALEGEGKCKEPATHEREGIAELHYCVEHARRLMPYCNLRLLKPQNKKVSEVAGRKPEKEQHAK